VEGWGLCGCAGRWCYLCAIGYWLLVHVLCVSTPHVEAKGYEHGGGWWRWATGF